MNAKFLEKQKSALFERMTNQKGRLLLWGSVWVQVPSVPEKAVCRSFIFLLKPRLEKPRKRPIGCAFTRIRSKLTFIDGAGDGGRTHTPKELVPKTSASAIPPLPQIARMTLPSYAASFCIKRISWVGFFVNSPRTKRRPPAWFGLPAAGRFCR